MPRLTRTQGLMAVGLGFALVSCSLDPTKSDLNTEGDPRVITVTVLSESAGEAATYCAGVMSGERLNANYCPTRERDVDKYPAPPITDATPINWRLRIIFNEHLQADAVEDLLPANSNLDPALCYDEDQDISCYGSLANTQPVTLTCGGEPVPYDGYYQITGNHLTTPGGPALVIEPIFPGAFVTTGTQDCEVTVNSEVRGKDHNQVTQRGPYGFGIADLAISGTSPAFPEEDQEPSMIDPTASLRVEFNAYIDPATLDGAILLDKIEDDETVTPVPITMTVLEDGFRVQIEPQAGDLEAGSKYELTVMSGIEDIEGGALVLDEPYVVPFTTLVSM